MTYTVNAPLVVIPNADGESGDWYGYQGAVVPDGLNDERRAQLVDDGLVVRGEQSDGDSEDSAPRRGRKSGS